MFIIIFKNILLLLISIFVLNAGESGLKPKGLSCTVESVLTVVNITQPTYILDSYGELIEDFDILQPAKINPGRYSITVSRKGSNLYKINGRSMYIKTIACYEYVYYTEAALDIELYKGIPVGSLYFFQ